MPRRLLLVALTLLAAIFSANIAHAEDPCWDDWNRTTLKYKRLEDACLKRGKATCGTCRHLSNFVVGMEHNKCYRYLSSTYGKAGAADVWYIFNTIKTSYEKACIKS